MKCTYVFLYVSILLTSSVYLNGMEKSTEKNIKDKTIQIVTLSTLRSSQEGSPKDNPKNFSPKSWARKQANRNKALEPLSDFSIN